MLLLNLFLSLLLKFRRSVSYRSQINGIFVTNSHFHKELFCCFAVFMQHKGVNMTGNKLFISSVTAPADVKKFYFQTYTKRKFIKNVFNIVFNFYCHFFYVTDLLQCNLSKKSHYSGNSCDHEKPGAELFKLLFCCLVLWLLKDMKHLLSPRPNSVHKNHQKDHVDAGMQARPDGPTQKKSECINSTLFRCCSESKAINEFRFILSGRTASSLSVQSETDTVTEPNLYTCSFYQRVSWFYASCSAVILVLLCFI